MGAQADADSRERLVREAALGSNRSADVALSSSETSKPSYIIRGGAAGRERLRVLAGIHLALDAGLAPTCSALRPEWCA